MDINLLEKIVRTIEPKSDDKFLEIGPGGSFNSSDFSKSRQPRFHRNRPTFDQIIEKQSNLKG